MFRYSLLVLMRVLVVFVFESGSRFMRVFIGTVGGSIAEYGPRIRGSRYLAGLRGEQTGCRCLRCQAIRRVSQVAVL